MRSEACVLFFCTSSHGDAALLWEELIRSGRPPAQPRSLVYLANNVKRGVDVFAVPAADEINVHVRAHLIAVSEVVMRASPDSASVNGQLTIAAAYAAFLGDATVRRVVNAAGGAAAGHGGAAAAAAAAAAVTATAAPAALAQVSVANAAAPLARTVSPEVGRFFVRSCLTVDRLDEIASRLERLPLTASVSVEIASLLRLPATITSGRRFVTSDDIQNYKSSVASAHRGGTVIAAHIIAMLLGPWTQTGWVVDPDVVFDAQGTLKKLRAVIVPPLSKILFRSHPLFWRVQVIDASFGFCRMNLEVFVVFWAHPVTNHGFPLATYLRLRGDKNSPDGIKIDDLDYMHRRFADLGWRRPAFSMSDRDSATLASWTRAIVADWAQASTTVDGARCALPPLASDDDVAPVFGPAAVFSALKDVQSVENALCDVAKNCTAADVERYNEYLENPLIYKGGFLAAPPTAIEGGSTSELTLFGQWGETFPELVAARALALLVEVRKASSAMATCKSPSDVDVALAGVQKHSFALSGTALADFAMALIERKAALCFFHAKQAMHDWVFENKEISRADAAVWHEQMQPAIDRIFSARPSEVDALWGTFKTRFAAYPKTLAYLEKNWLHPQWRCLWTKSGRYNVGHSCVETSNIAETFFRVFKVDVLGGKQPTDIVDFVKLLYGVPLEPETQTQCYLFTMYLELVNTYRTLESRVLSNTLLPRREHIDVTRSRFSEITSIKGAVRPGRRNGLYFVARSAARTALCSDLTPNNADFRAVDIFLNHCECNESSAFCPHVLSARFHHVHVLKFAPTWLDSELSLVWAFEHKSTLMAPGNVRADLVDSGAAVVAPATIAQLNESSAALPRALVPAVNAAFNAVEDAILRAQSLLQLEVDASGEERGARIKELARGKRIVDSLNSLVATAATFVGDRRAVHGGGALPLPARGQRGDSARIERDAGRALVLSPGFALPTSAGAAGGGVAVRGGGAPRADVAQAQPDAVGGRKRDRGGNDGGRAGVGVGGTEVAAASVPPFVLTTRRQRLGGEVAGGASPDAAGLADRLKQALAVCKRYCTERNAISAELAVATNDCEALKRELAQLEIDAAQGVDFAAAAAYDDAAERALAIRRLREFKDEPAVCDALEGLANRFHSLAVDSKDEARAHRDRIFRRLTRDEQQFWRLR